MFRLIFGALLGAAAMYFLDPREGRRRREKLGHRVQELQHRGHNGTEMFEDTGTIYAGPSSATSNAQILDDASKPGRKPADQMRRSSSTRTESVQGQQDDVSPS